jgi:hypothetical protein
MTDSATSAGWGGRLATTRPPDGLIDCGGTGRLGRHTGASGDSGAVGDPDGFSVPGYQSSRMSG